MLDLEAIRLRVDAATPGPWGSVPQERTHIPTRYPRPAAVTVSGSVIWECTYRQGNEQPNRDADFISNARTDVPALLAEVERLRGLVRRAWEFPEEPTAADGEVSMPVEWDARGAWLESWRQLDDEIRAALAEASQ